MSTGVNDADTYTLRKEVKHISKYLSKKKNITHKRIHTQKGCNKWNKQRGGHVYRQTHGKETDRWAGSQIAGQTDVR